jgi:hypothetical protein
MIGVVRLESLMMHQGVRSKGVIDGADGPVHEETMQRPFKERREHDASSNTDGGPEQK